MWFAYPVLFGQRQTSSDVPGTYGMGEVMWQGRLVTACGRLHWMVALVIRSISFELKFVTVARSVLTQLLLMSSSLS